MWVMPPAPGKVLSRWLDSVAFFFLFWKKAEYADLILNVATKKTTSSMKSARPPEPYSFILSSSLLLLRPQALAVSSWEAISCVCTCVCMCVGGGWVWDGGWGASVTLLPSCGALTECGECFLIGELPGGGGNGSVKAGLVALAARVVSRLAVR